MKCDAGAAICVIGDGSFFDASQSTGGEIKSTGYALQLEKGLNTSIKLNGAKISTSGTLSLMEVNADNGTTPTDIALIDLKNSTATAANNGQGLLLNVGNSSNLKFTASNSQLYGDIKAAADSLVNMELKSGSSLTGSIDPINLDIDASSQWNVTKNSDLENLTNAGTVSFTDPGASNTFKTVTVDSYVGVSGSKLAVNTYLDNDASKSDNLIISNTKVGTKVGNTTVGGPTDGGTATGQTSIYVTNRGGLGAQTVDKGILLVQAVQGATPAASATTAVDAFSLGHTVSAGAYEYSLYRNNDESWYLFSSKNQKDPDYSDEASATAVLGPLAQLYNTAILGSWRERMGGTAYANPEQLNMQRSAVAPLWVRVGGGKGRHAGGQDSLATISSITYSPDYKYDFNFLQMGGDVYQRHTEQGSRQVGGVYFTTGSIYGDVFSYDELTAARSKNATLAKVDNISLGAYWTQIGADGSYVDIVGQYTDHDLTVRQADEVTGSGHTWAASIEAGKAMALNSSWTLVPQAQLRWQNIRFNDMTAIASQKKVGTYRFDNNNSLETRLGVEARYKTGPLDVAWMRLDMLHEFKGNYTSKYTPVQTGQAQPQFSSSRKGSSLELLGGMELEVAKNVGVYGAVGYRQGLSHSGDHAWNAQVGVRWGF